MKHIIAKKLDMTQRFREDGKVVPVTLLQAGPCTVTQVRTMEKDGYDAVQLGFGEGKNIPMPQQGHLKASGTNSRALKEFRLEEAAELKVGDKVEVNQFNPGEFVHITGVSKGKGFQGVVKRHGFKGSPATHGHKDQHRMPGSIGAVGPARVFKGTRMGGRMGGDRVTVKNLEIVDVDAKTGVMAVKGAVPGARGTVLLISGGYEKRQSWN
ncbi:MAG: 50S ribosomal protein L3 [Patescibacteria group bacterium]|nr:50S ribosomal protein L3 [Patescibacteria group bacterium]